MATSTEKVATNHRRNTTGIGRDTAPLRKKGAKVDVLRPSAKPKDNQHHQPCPRSAEAMACFRKIRCLQVPPTLVLVQKTVEKNYGPPDVLPSTTQALEGQGKPSSNRPRIWDSVLKFNLNGTWLCLKYEISRAQARQPGAIVNMSSVAGLMGSAGAAPLCRSKQASSASQNARHLMSQTNIRPSTRMPRVIETAHGRPAPSPIRQASKRVLCMQPWALRQSNRRNPEAVLGLCYSKSSFMNGKQILWTAAVRPAPIQRDRWLL